MVMSKLLAAIYKRKAAIMHHPIKDGALRLLKPSIGWVPTNQVELGITAPVIKKVSVHTRIPTYLTELQHL